MGNIMRNLFCLANNTGADQPLHTDMYHHCSFYNAYVVYSLYLVHAYQTKRSNAQHLVEY